MESPLPFFLFLDWLMGRRTEPPLVHRIAFAHLRLHLNVNVQHLPGLGPGAGGRTIVKRIARWLDG